MTTITESLMRKAAQQVAFFANTDPTVLVHTVTVTMNGQHGGVDVRIQGNYEMDMDDFDETVEVH